MIESERPLLISDEKVIQEGERQYNSYAYQALNSNVPPSFFSLSRAVSLDYLPNFDIIDVTEVLLDKRFPDSRQAWLALKYAEAIANIKAFQAQILAAHEPIVFKEDLDRMYFFVGVAAINENDDDETYMVKEAVEEYFANPISKIKMDYLTELVRKDKVH